MQRHTVTHVSTETTDLGLAQRGHSSMPKAMPVYRSAHIPAKRPAEVWGKHVLEQMVHESVRQVRRSAVGLSTKDHDLLKAFARGQYLTGVMRFLEIGQKCEDVTDATAFPEALRGFQVQFHPRAQVDLLDAFGAETHANGIANDAQHAFWKEPTEANRHRAIEALNRQLVETHRSLMALHRERGR